MATSYPGGLDTYSTHVNISETIDASHVNNIQDAVVAIETALGTSPAGGFTTLRDRVAVAAVKAADYLIYKSGSNYIATNGATGGNDYSSTDAGAVLQSVITALGTGGGTVQFKTGSYAWSTVPALVPNGTGWIRIIGEPGTIITLSTSAPRFLDFGRTAAGQTFNFIHIEGFTINAAALSATGSGHHMVIGTWQSSGTLSGQDVNFDHIIVRRIRTLNVRTAADATAQHFNVWIALHATTPSTQYKITNILVEQCEFNGGNYGVGVYGVRQSGFTPSTSDADIVQDNIVIRDIYHDTGTTPTGFGSHAHVHVGSAAKGGTVWIERITGKNSWDVGIEIDNFETAYVNDCRLENYNGYGMAITNFCSPTNLKAQTYYLTNITGYWSASGVWSSDASSLLGIVQSTNAAGTALTFGRVIARNVKVFRTGSSMDTNGIEGDLFALKNQLIEFMLDGAQYQGTGFTHTTGSPTPTIGYAAVGTSGTTRMTLRNIDVRCDGTLGVASPAIGWVTFHLNGNLDMLVENVKADIQLTNVASFSIHGFDLGTGSTSTMTGIIRGFKWSTNDTGGRGIVVADTTGLTISNRLVIEHCDFSGMASGGAEVLQIGTANKAKTRFYNNVWKTFPPLAYTVTAPTSNVGTQYVDGYDATLSITGGTVSKVEISRDNTTYVQVAAATNMAVPIGQADYYRITYTVAPTVTIIPRV